MIPQTVAGRGLKNRNNEKPNSFLIAGRSQNMGAAQKKQPRTLAQGWGMETRDPGSQLQPPLTSQVVGSRC